MGKVKTLDLLLNSLYGAVRTIDPSDRKIQRVLKDCAFQVLGMPTTGV